MEEQNKKINRMTQFTSSEIQRLANVDTVIGKPIVTASGMQIIPFSKVTVGTLSGGGEYGELQVVEEKNEMPFAGGNGSVVSMKPMGFLIDDGKSCRMMRVTDEPLDTLIERASEIIKSVASKEPYEK